MRRYVLSPMYNHLQASIRPILGEVFTLSSNGDGSLSSWNATTPFNGVRNRIGAVGTDGFIYAIGGQVVERAVVHADGALGSWESMAPLNIARSDLAVAMANGYIYALGGNGDGALDSVEMAEINEDGTLQPWIVTSPMNVKRGALVAVAVNGYLYALGGQDYDTYDSVEKAQINPDGTLGSWKNVNSMVRARYLFAAASVNGYLYAVGGDINGGLRTGNVERTVINPNGTLGAWHEVAAMSTARQGLAVVATDRRLYAIGGQDNTWPYNLRSVEYTTVRSDGTMEPWQTTTSLNTARSLLATCVVGDYIYALGGENEMGLLDSTEYAGPYPLTLSSVSPSAIPADLSTTIVITGTNFLSMPAVYLGKTFSVAVSAFSTNVLTATVPAGLADGICTVTVENPNGRVASLVSALRVDGTIPTAHSLSINGGAHSSTSPSVTLSISGTDPGDTRRRTCQMTALTGQ